MLAEAAYQAVRERWTGNGVLHQLSQRMTQHCFTARTSLVSTPLHERGLLDDVAPLAADNRHRCQARSCSSIQSKNACASAGLRPGSEYRSDAERGGTASRGTMRLWTAPSPRLKLPIASGLR